MHYKKIRNKIVHIILYKNNSINVINNQFYLTFIIIRKITQLEGGKSEMELLRSIEEAAFSILSQLGAPPPRRIQQSSLRSILAQLQSMKTYVDGTIDTRLDFYIEVGHFIFLWLIFIKMVIVN